MSIVLRDFGVGVQCDIRVGDALTSFRRVEPRVWVAPFGELMGADFVEVGEIWFELAQQPESGSKGDKT